MTVDGRVLSRDHRPGANYSRTQNPASKSNRVRDAPVQQMRNASYFYGKLAPEP